MTRRTIRYGAAAIATVMAAIYLLIGFKVLRVVAEQPGGAGQLGGGAAAAGLFAIGAVLLVGLDQRPLWVVGAIVQVLVAALYIAVAPSREPNFEIWGITLRVLQIPLFAALVYLALRRPGAETATSQLARPVGPPR